MIAITELRPPMPILPLIVLAVCLGASMVIFFTLIRRWTSRRQHVALARWCREKGYRLASSTVSLPPPVSELANPDIRVQWMLIGSMATLVQLVEGAGATPPAKWWNLLIRRTVSNWPATALRPASADCSAFDLFALAPFPMLPVNERYTLQGVDMPRARELGESPAAGLLPRDIGLLLHGEFLVLDFSARPFDGIEFGRMLVLADQLERAISMIPGNAIPAGGAGGIFPA